MGYTEEVTGTHYYWPTTARRSGVDIHTIYILVCYGMTGVACRGTHTHVIPGFTLLILLCFSSLRKWREEVPGAFSLQLLTKELFARTPQKKTVNSDQNLQRFSKKAMKDPSSNNNTYFEASTWGVTARESGNSSYEIICRVEFIFCCVSWGFFRQERGPARQHVGGKKYCTYLHEGAFRTKIKQLLFLPSGLCVRVPT